MCRRLAPALVIITLAAAAVAPATAHAAPKSPHVITVLGGNASLGIVDNGAKGPTPGDIRTLSLALTNTKGQPAGQVEVVQTLTRQVGDVGTAIKSIVITLPRGTITGLGVTQFVDITDPQARPNDKTEQIAITGGTGAFVGATGQIDITVLPGFASRWTIALSN